MTLEVVKEGLTLLVVGTVFASFLIPVAVLLFFFTSVTIWRSPLFILNVLSIILGLALQIMYIYVIVSRCYFFLAVPPLVNSRLTYKADKYHDH